MWGAAVVRKVRGYLTTTGAYFDNKASAEAYEAVQAFNKAASEFYDGAGLSGTIKDYMIDKLREFLLNEKDVVKAYISLVHSIPAPDANDIRAPDTGPVDAGPPQSLPLAPEHTAPEGFEAIFGRRVEQLLDGGEESDQLSFDRLMGEGAEGLHERVWLPGISEVESLEEADESLREGVEVTTELATGGESDS